MLALIVGREAALVLWRWSRLAALTAVFGTAYTIFSEWMNIAILGSWAYAPSMPRFEIVGFEMGMAPLAQWLIAPPLALYFARRSLAETHPPGN